MASAGRAFIVHVELEAGSSLFFGSLFLQTLTPGSSHHKKFEEFLVDTKSKGLARGEGREPPDRHEVEVGEEGGRALQYDSVREDEQDRAVVNRAREMVEEFLGLDQCRNQALLSHTQTQAQVLVNKGPFRARVAECKGTVLGQEEVEQVVEC